MTATIIDHNPALKKPIMAVLSLCQGACANRLEVEAAAAEVWSDAYRLSPMATIDALIRKGAMMESVLLNGEPYDGSLEDMQLDENVPDDAVVESNITVTEAGAQLLMQYAPDETLRLLFSSHPHYADVYAVALRACSVEGGASREALEAAINTMPALKPDPETKQTKVYPQYFIDALETAGGIEWKASWLITEEGRRALEQLEAPAEEAVLEAEGAAEAGQANAAEAADDSRA